MPVFSGFSLWTQYKKRPPGSTCGQRWEPSPREASSVVSGEGVPPDAGTWNKPDAIVPNRMRPSLLHAPPRDSQQRRRSPTAPRPPDRLAATCLPRRRRWTCCPGTRRDRRRLRFRRSAAPPCRPAAGPTARSSRCPKRQRQRSGRRAIGRCRRRCFQKRTGCPRAD